MELFKQTLIKQKNFIEGVALHGLNPQQGNDNVISILDAYKEIDSTAEVLAECATCKNIYTGTFRIIYAYCESVNWFETKNITKNGKK